jgi:hypothetical protein
MAIATLTFDRSERWKDQDGRLHVGRTNISKATVNPYRGSEIPGALGLEPDRIYQMLRDPTELAKGAETFNNLPLLSRHVAVSADNPQEDLVAGSTGTDASFEAPYLTNSLVIWRTEDIEACENGKKCQLSCAYYYEPHMTPGVYDGMAYDGVMRNIRGNHVALVPLGRAGPDVMVADSEEGTISMPQLISRHAIAVKGALAAYLRPKMLPGTVLALDSALGSVNRLNWKTQKIKVLATILEDASKKLAKDQSIDLNDLKAFVAVFDEEKDDDDDKAKDDEIEAMDAEEEAEESRAREEEERDGMSTEDRAKRAKDRKGARDAAHKARDKKARDGKRAKDATRGKDKDLKDWAEEEEEEEAHDAKAKDGKAMDEAIDVALKKERQRNREATEAREVVRPLCGKLDPAMDSAEDIYKFVLKQKGVAVDGINSAGLKALVGMLPKPGAQPDQRQRMALDAANDGVAMFPQLSRIRQG